MVTGSSEHRSLIDKLEQLPPECIAEVEDFIDLLRTREQDHGLRQAAAKLSQASFARVWDNPDDAAYDDL